MAAIPVQGLSVRSTTQLFGHSLFSFTETVAATRTMIILSTSNRSMLSTASTASDSVSTACRKQGRGDSGAAIDKMVQEEKARGFYFLVEEQDTY